MALVLCAQRIAMAQAQVRAALLRLGDALDATSDAESVVRLLLDTTRSLTNADRALWWFDRGPAIELRVASGDDSDVTRRLGRGEGIVGESIDRGEPVVHSGGLAVPVRVRNRLYGVLSVHRRNRAFTETEVADIVGLAGQAAAAIEVTHHHDETRRLSLTDGLTGLWNRRQFELRIAQELERAARFGERFAVVIVDLDGFKAINDTHGHLIGDAVLVETAHRLVTHTREVDTVARYGGEEFVLLLPQTDARGALKVADKVREELAVAPVLTDAGPLRITLSAGVACHPDNGAGMDSLLRAADAALYTAKASGKNRVVPADTQDSGASPA